jgi:hypothetical protein
MLIEIAKSLENEELLEFLVRFEESRDPLGKLNVISRILRKAESKLDITEEISFISQHFHEFGSSELKQLSYDLLYIIVSDSHLQLADEDSLVSIIYEMGGQYLELLRYVEFVFLSVDGIRNVLSMISIDDLNLESKFWTFGLRFVVDLLIQLI